MLEHWLTADPALQASVSIPKLYNNQRKHTVWLCGIVPQAAAVPQTKLSAVTVPHHPGRLQEDCPDRRSELGRRLLRLRTQGLALVAQHPPEDLPARTLRDRLDEDHAAREPLVL